MILYAGSTSEFVRDTTYNRIADILATAFMQYYGRSVSPAEYASWCSSLQYVKNLVVERALDDNMIVLEYELPYCSQRIDCTFFGLSYESFPHVALVELKQWSDAEESDIEGNVVTFVGGAERMVAHPAMQVAGYWEHLWDFVIAFQDEQPLGLSACVYCHNYFRKPAQGLHAACYSGFLQEFPVFTKEDFDQLGDWLYRKVGKGGGADVYNRFMKSPIRPSKKLLEHVSAMIDGQRAFSLLNEQITANNTIVDKVRKATRSGQKTVIIVRGGPGTGKSVIALNAVAELARMGKQVLHATGSKSFTTALRKIVGERGGKLFQYFHSFRPARVAEDELDGLICDEAHRIRESSNFRFTKRSEKSGMRQIDELIRAARVSAFFIDDDQVVRGGEIGSTELIKECASDWNAEIYEFELDSQFRCSGSDDYLAWVEDVLELQGSSQGFRFRTTDRMHFEIVSSPTQLQSIIEGKNQEKANSARLVAGFCWPWSDPLPDGTLPDDVVIGDFAMPWEARDEKGRLAPGIPKWFEWASKPEGVHQVGCIYTTQGFEFDYIGVIFGPDLLYDWDQGEWVGRRENSCDPYLKRSGGDFTQYVKNIYRVLLTRGMKGCYVYFVDKQTEKFFKSRMET